MDQKQILLAILDRAEQVGESDDDPKADAQLERQIRDLGHISRPNPRLHARIEALLRHIFPR